MAKKIKPPDESTVSKSATVAAKSAAVVEPAKPGAIKALAVKLQTPKQGIPASMVDNLCASGASIEQAEQAFAAFMETGCWVSPAGIQFGEPTPAPEDDDA